jgi:formamidopyrimidine-DNA glycosylase
LRAVVRLDAGWLVFQDTRRFGTMALLAAAELPAPTGLDPTGKAFTVAALKRLLAGTRTPIKVWLLRQDRLVGMGNIYASESLFLAGIHPERAAGTLNDGEIARLRGAIRQVLQRSILAGGTTFSDFRDANGLMGNYAKKLRVYGHAGEACPTCRGVIERVTQGQRSTFFCPQCQPAEPRGGF